MQRQMNRIFIFALAGIMLLAWGGISLTADGAARMDTSRELSLTIHCIYDGVPMANEEFEIYKVEEMTDDVELKVAKDFENYSVNFDVIAQDDGESIAEILTGYVERDNVDPLCEDKTDKNGDVTFKESEDGLTQGVYLVVGQSLEINQVEYTTEPFFVSVPSMNQDDTFIYDVEVNPKYRKNQKEKYVDISAVKAWKDEGQESGRPESVTLQLLKDGNVYETQELNAGNNWRHTWKNLEADADWNVVEKSVPDGYTVSSSLSDGTFTITNDISSGRYGKGSEDGSGSNNPESTPALTPGSTPAAPPTATQKPTLKKKLKKALTHLFGDKSKGQNGSDGQDSTGTGTTTQTVGDWLPQTGQCWWPVPVMLAAGLVLLIIKKLRGKKGRITMLLGTLLVLAAFGLTGYNYRESSRAGKEAQAEVQALEKEIPAQTTGSKKKQAAFVPNPDTEMPVVTLNGHSYIGKIEIPTLNLKLPVMSEWSYPNLRIAPCRYTGSAYRSNMIIAAHNYSTHFGRLKELSVGDKVIFTDADGNAFNYQVADMEVLLPTAVEEMKEGDWDLTLFTCTIGGRTRVTIRCKTYSS